MTQQELDDLFNEIVPYFEFPFPDQVDDMNEFGGIVNMAASKFLSLDGAYHFKDKLKEMFFGTGDVLPTITLKIPVSYLPTSGSKSFSSDTVGTRLDFTVPEKYLKKPCLILLCLDEENLPETTSQTYIYGNRIYINNVRYYLSYTSNGNFYTFHTI